ncbi:MAG TPA: 2,3-bisphosphoglycerate-independent phosphoglycerate mutase [Solirubrobacteraceae bacterium]|nr:2,3-bisphosphoglycerate-independent phosphoglycerate mutase [Solirubrobacteraceae bacterium]
MPCACLVVLDGWGLAPPGPGNAVSLAATPVFDELWETYPHTTLTASGRAVGLPEGQMGNSEVGHLNLGAGSVVRQDLTRIDDAVLDGVLSENPAITHALTCSERVHLIGLVSDGGVHSSLRHLQAIVELAGRLAVRDLVIHCFTDGRDTPPHSGVDHVGLIEEWCALWPPGARGRVRVASVVGRWYAMDRDRRWERIQAAYDLLVHGRAPQHAATGVQAVREAYERGETDEFIAPTSVGEEGYIRPWDSVLCFNFRPDRVREITRALAEPLFGEGDEELPGWEGRRGIEPVEQYTTLTQYEEDWEYPIAFPPQRPAVTLAAVLERAQAPQLHVAETEKYAHVTYFFNGGEEAPHRGEERALAPSPRDVPTYDLAPDMSARETTDMFLEAFRRHREDGFRFAVLNFANPDMVGHTGVIPAAVRAIETVDGCLGEVVRAVLDAGGVCLVTADHGNAEYMLQPDGSPNTAHTSNPVPLILTLPGLRLLQREGILADVAPTILALLGIPQPEEMSGSSLILRSGGAT